jgi:hypothetical protein
MGRVKAVWQAEQEKIDWQQNVSQANLKQNNDPYCLWYNVSDDAPVVDLGEMMARWEEL